LDQKKGALVKEEKDHVLIEKFERLSGPQVVRNIVPLTASDK
jgi:hypothetical protein